MTKLEKLTPQSRTLKTSATPYPRDVVGGRQTGGTDNKRRNSSCYRKGYRTPSTTDPENKNHVLSFHAKTYTMCIFRMNQQKLSGTLFWKLLWGRNVDLIST